MSAPVIVIDIFATTLTVARLDDRGMGEPVTSPGAYATTAALVDQLAAMVDACAGDPPAAVCVSLPRAIEFATGRVIPGPRPGSASADIALDLPLADVALRPLLTERLGVPAFVDNAAHVAALAEAHDAALRPATRNLVLLAFGDTVGGGLVLDGRIYRGTTGAAGELGHTILGMDLAGTVPTRMGFPQPGSLEFVASGHALDTLAAVARRVHPRSALAQVRADGKSVLGDDAIDAALAGDRSAARMITIWGQRIGIAVANAIHTFDPEEVVIAGDAARAGDRLLEQARVVAEEYLRPGLGTHTTVRLARYDERGQVLGAALLARGAAGLTR